MRIYPAIDIHDNMAVRLLYGDINKKTIYGKPLDFLKEYEKKGARYVHIVDLNAAFGDKNKNKNVILELAKMSNIKIQIGGGIKSREDIVYYLEDLRLNAVVLGTACVNNRDLVAWAIEKFGSNRIILALDAKNGLVHTNGWQKGSGIDLYELATDLKSIGGKRILFTDISKDGALSGVNYKECKKLQESTNMEVIASGGIRDINDIYNLKKNQIWAAILGRSLFEKTIDFEEVIKVGRDA